MGRPGRQFAAGVILFALTMAGRTAFAEPAAIELVYLPPLTPDIQALPRLVATTPAMDRINDQLSHLDAEEASWAANCNFDPPRSFVERTVDVVFAGPRYLGLLTLDASYCPGAAHGNFSSTPLTYDLVTGIEVIWPEVFPSKLQDPLRHPSWTGYVIGSERLTTLYLAQANHLYTECFDAIQRENNVYFRVWPSAADRGLVLMPTGLSHANQACADPIALPVAILRVNGFAGHLLDVLTNPAPLDAARQNTAPLRFD